MILAAFDYETTGFLPKKPYDYASFNFPRAVSIGLILFNTHTWKEVARLSTLIIPDVVIPESATRVHGITTERALHEGAPAKTVACMTVELIKQADVLVSHNFDYDVNIYGGECYRNGLSVATPPRTICVMKETTDLLKLPRSNGGFKYPKLEELFIYCFGRDNPSYQALFGKRDFHEAFHDAWAAGLCGMRLLQMGVL